MARKYFEEEFKKKVKEIHGNNLDLSEYTYTRSIDSSKYVNKSLNTFAMELSFIDRSNMLHEGWLLDTSKVNNSFLFVWIDRATQNILESKEDIIELEYCLVKKEAILDYLSELGWSQEKLLQKSTFIRENKFENLGNITKNGCKFSYSPKLFEKPVNILISRDKLREISVLNRRIVNGN